VCNIYAPNGFDAVKTAFVHEIFQALDMWDNGLIIGGDFNTTLVPADRYCRGVTNSEMAVANLIVNYTQDQNLEDCWAGKSGFTWRKGKVMSKLDRIFHRLDQYEITDTKTCWTFTTSDHAAVVTTFKHKIRPRCRHQHIKLDNSVVLDANTLSELKQYLVEQLVSAAGMLPQVKLEFAKMTIRTKALEITARNRTRVENRLNEIESEIKNYMELLTRYTDDNSQNIILTELESLNLMRKNIMNEQGNKLAHRAKAKWYNDGEGSNKYFLNMLKRRGQANEMSELIVEGNTIDTETGIRQAVTNFYSQLYNRDLGDLEVDDSFFQHMFSVDPVDKNGIDAPIQVGELWEALKPTKATTPGPDGISNTYLKKLWDVLGPLIAAAWSDTLARGELMSSHRTSLLRLIPKAGKDVKQLKKLAPHNPL
jgi:hypothetical protein